MPKVIASVDGRRLVYLPAGAGNLVYALRIPFGRFAGRNLAAGIADPLDRPGDEGARKWQVRGDGLRSLGHRLIFWQRAGLRVGWVRIGQAFSDLLLK